MKLDTLRISKDLFFRLVNEFPTMAVEMMRELARRLDSTNQQLSAANQRITEMENAGA
jgi:CRP-like cAMP-binding protein